MSKYNVTRKANRPGLPGGGVATGELKLKKAWLFTLPGIQFPEEINREIAHFGMEE
jgi:hypothetical protein